MRQLAITFAIFINTCLPARADDVIEDLEIKTYDVRGVNLAEVEDQLWDKGPDGYWARTSASWRWDSDCNVSLDVTIIMPRLQYRGRLTDAELAIWDKMEAALLAHEMDHVAISRQTAQTVKDANCRVDSDAIQAENRAQNSAFDARTNHGAQTGVTLRP